MNSINDAIEFLDELVAVVEENKKRKFEFITNTDGFFGAIMTKRAILKTCKLFKYLTKLAYKKYQSDLKAGYPHPGYLIDQEKFKRCEEFYRNEVETIKDSIYEYLCYVHYSPGKYFRALLGFERPKEDLVDYSGLGLADKE